MTSVAFYHLKSPRQHGKMRLVCQLAATAYRKGHKVYVRAQDEDQCAMLNQLMWTFAPNSYVPHISLAESRDPDLEKYPVVIGFDDPPEKFNDVLISLQHEVPAYIERFQRVVEPVDADSEDAERAKSRFEQYETKLESKPTTFYV